MYILFTYIRNPSKSNVGMLISIKKNVFLVKVSMTIHTLEAIKKAGPWLLSIFSRKRVTKKISFERAVVKTPTRKVVKSRVEYTEEPERNT